MKKTFLESDVTTLRAAYALGRSEGRADVAVMLRKVVDPTDANHWNIDGTLAEVSRLKTELDAAKNSYELDAARRIWQGIQAILSRRSGG